MKNLTLLSVLSGLGIVCTIVFCGFFVFLLLGKEKLLNRIVINYIFAGFIGCVMYGLMHNFFVHPLLFNAIIGLDFSEPKVTAWLITWGYRATIYFLGFAIWLRVLLKRAKVWKNRTRIFSLLIVHAVLISTAWITDFEKLLYYNSTIDAHHFLHWIGGIIGCMMTLLLEYIFIEKQIIRYLEIGKAFQKLRGRLLFLFLGIASIMLLALFGIVIGCLGIDPPGLLILKMLIFSVLFLIPLVIVIVRTTGDFQGSLDQAVTFLRAAAGQDFTKPLAKTSNDEFGQLAESLALLKENFRRVISVVRTSSGEVDGSASKISDALGKLFTTIESFVSRLVTEASRRVESSTAAVRKLNEMSEGIGKIFGNIKTQVALSDENAASIKSMADTNAKITGRVEFATSVTSKLSDAAQQGDLLIETSLAGVREIEKSSKRINEIIGVIDNVSEQAKILAINASIEAVHAGQAGRGFSVVASQMRNLADNTATNARMIYDLLKDIYNKVERALAEMERSRESFRGVRGYVDQSKDLSLEISGAMAVENTSLSRLLASTSELSELVREIAGLSERLSESGADIKGTFEGLRSAAKDETLALEANSNVISGIATEVNDLARENTILADGLKGEIAVFKMEAET